MTRSAIHQERRADAQEFLGLGIQDLDDMKDGPLNLDIGRAIAEAGEQIPSAYPLSPIGDLRIVLMTGRNEDELKSVTGAS